MQAALEEIGSKSISSHAFPRASLPNARQDSWGAGYGLAQFKSQSDLSFKPAWSTHGDSGQPGLHSETLNLKKKTKREKRLR